MLVFISDIHWTDGTVGETVCSHAFLEFSSNLRNMVERAKAKSLEIVFLGDIFDLLRSEAWLNTKVRPWDVKSDAQEKVAKEIIQATLTHPENKQSLNNLKEIFGFTVDGQKIPVCFKYLIGNHDWLVNRYESCRTLIKEALGVTFLPWEGHCWEDYKVFARHGDIYDNLNYDGKTRDASSLGDAIVIELFSRFPKEVEKMLGSSDAEKEFVLQLKEIDNVRPVWNVPTFIIGVLERYAKPPINIQEIKNLWNNMVKEFLSLPFLKNHHKWLVRLFFSVVLPMRGLKRLDRLSSTVITWVLNKVDPYNKAAYQEADIVSGRAQYVLYGHTHDHKIVPLDIASGSGLEKIYFNTGAWRKTHVLTEFDQGHREFIGWYVCTFVCFYLKSEHSNNAFEVWNGALGKDN